VKYQRENTHNEPRQHSPVVSVALHLVPGVLLLGGIFLFSQPALVSGFGIDERLGSLFGYLMSLLIFLVTLQLGILLLFSKRHFGKLAVRPAIYNTQKSTRRTYLVLIPLLFAYNAVLFTVVAPRIQPYIVNALFSWYPENYNLQLLMQSVLQNPAEYARYQGIFILVAAYIVLSGIVGPLVEELYFRGFLLPRMEGYAKKWAPFLNAVLFSFYHFFSPWENLIRIVGVYPLVYVVWRKKDIRISILVHVLLNTIGGIVFLIVLLS
jgi:membrane protease YdiL (CAAX protease family)